MPTIALVTGANRGLGVEVSRQLAHAGHTVVIGARDQLSKLLAGTSIKVNAVCPGFVQTDLTPTSRDLAPLTLADAARVVVRYALIDDSGPSGGFFDQAGAVAW